MEINNNVWQRQKRKIKSQVSPGIPANSTPPSFIFLRQAEILHTCGKKLMPALYNLYWTNTFRTIYIVGWYNIFKSKLQEINIRRGIEEHSREEEKISPDSRIFSLYSHTCALDLKMRSQTSHWARYGRSWKKNGRQNLMVSS